MVFWPNRAQWQFIPIRSFNNQWEEGLQLVSNQRFILCYFCVCTVLYSAPISLRINLYCKIESWAGSNMKNFTLRPRHTVYKLKWWPSCKWDQVPWHQLLHPCGRTHKTSPSAGREMSNFRQHNFSFYKLTELQHKSFTFFYILMKVSFGQWRLFEAYC